jgi:hypothetical protein
MGAPLSARRPQRSSRSLSSHRPATGLSRATVSRILRRLRLRRVRDLEPAPPVIPYEHPRPGDVLHLDIKKIGRFRAVGCRITGNRRGRIHRAGWEYIHVAIDDHSRIAFSQILPNQKASSAAAFLQAAGRLLCPTRHLGPPSSHRSVKQAQCRRARTLVFRFPALLAPAPEQQRAVGPAESE